MDEPGRHRSYCSIIERFLESYPMPSFRSAGRSRVYPRSATAGAQVGNSRLGMRRTRDPVTTAVTNRNGRAYWIPGSLASLGPGNDADMIEFWKRSTSAVHGNSCGWAACLTPPEDGVVLEIPRY